MSNYIFDDLNPVQKEAVLQTEGPLLILAGAGSGKTRVIAHRVAYLIQSKKVNPKNILAVTFTNKAAEEMRERIKNLLGFSFNNFPLISTFHSACVKILRNHIKHLGQKSNFTILDETDRMSLMKDVLKEINIDEKYLNPVSVIARISNAKNDMLTPEDYFSVYKDFKNEDVGKVYELYEKRLKLTNALDFDDLLMKTVILFEKFPEILSYYQNLFKYIMVDEYQDTNHSQYRLVKMLSFKHRNICVVGDDDQSIYRWRGADLRNILNFEKDYPDTRIIRLEQNYRSTKKILDAAGYVISNNIGRKGKDLWTENEDGEKVYLYGAWDEKGEADFVARKIQDLILEKGYCFGDFAIFYRVNAQSRVIEDQLRINGIPYVIVGGLRFYERKEIKDIIAYLRLIYNPMDAVAFKRAIVSPSRSIGKATMAKIEEYANSNNISLLEASRKMIADDGIPERQANALEAFFKYIKDIKKSMGEQSLSRSVEDIIISSGYRDELKSENSIESMGRLENLKELIIATQDFTERNPNATLKDYLESIALISNIDEYSPEQGKVTLMTLHSAKGLEFPCVFITGVEEGIFPHFKSLHDTHELEEERRLCYVGITRAKKLLYLSYAMQRRLYNSQGRNEPSRFISEIAKELIENINGKPLTYMRYYR